MRITTVLNKLLVVQGLWVQDLQIQLERCELWLLVAPRWRTSRCGGCDRRVRRRHDRSWRSWRHLDAFGCRVVLR